MTAHIAFRLLLFALPLGLDTFALSTVLGVTPMPASARVRLALTFAAAEGLMPAVGLLLGLPLGSVLGRWSGYLAGALLAGVGLWMIVKERGDDKDDKQEEWGKDDEAVRIAGAVSRRGWALVGLALSVSLDELAVGFSFGVLSFPLAPALGVIALQALLVSLAGQWIGAHAGRALGERAEQLAGPALCLLGAWFILAQALGVPF
jgi:manganese efflux pump family protein